MNKLPSNNEKLLKRLEILIQNVGYRVDKDTAPMIAEFSSILENNTLDLNNDSNVLKKPLIISAAMLNTSELIKLLINKGVDIHKTIISPQENRNEEEQEYYIIEEVTALDLLWNSKNKIEDYMTCLTDESETMVLSKKALKEVSNCITILENQINVEQI